MYIDKIKIGDRYYSSDELELLTENPPGQDIPSFILLLARVLENPMNLPRMLSRFCALRTTLGNGDKEEFRMALLRVQIDSDLRMHEDIQRYQQRKYVAQVVEIMLFDELFLAPRPMEEELDL